jgi:hypothetical protein
MRQNAKCGFVGWMAHMANCVVRGCLCFFAPTFPMLSAYSEIEPCTYRGANRTTGANMNLVRALCANLNLVSAQVQT